MVNEIEVCMEIIKEMLVKDEPVSIITPEYVKLKNIITNFVYKNHLEKTNEWKLISDSMIYKSNQLFNIEMANNMLVSLEVLKRLYLTNINEKIIFDCYVNEQISKVAKKKYFDGYYSDAVESAFKEINSRCKKIYKEKCGKELDGSDLMNKLFTPDNPILRFEDNSTETGKNIQRGFMFIFSGAMMGIRNPKAHSNTNITKDEAFKRIVFASLLMDKIDEAEKYEESLE